MQNIKVRSQFVQWLKRIETDGRTDTTDRTTFFVNAIGNIIEVEPVMAGNTTNFVRLVGCDSRLIDEET